jgi:hypothetical protein
VPPANHRSLTGCQWHALFGGIFVDRIFKGRKIRSVTDIKEGAMLTEKEKKIIGRFSNEKKLKMLLLTIVIIFFLGAAFLNYIRTKIIADIGALYASSSAKISQLKTETKKEEFLKMTLLNYHKMHVQAFKIGAAALLNYFLYLLGVASIMIILLIARDIRLGRIIKKLQAEKT